MILAPLTRLGSYEIVAAIGAGGMGKVYRTHDARLPALGSAQAADELTSLVALP